MAKIWTDEEKLKVLLRLPWTILAEPGDDPGERVLRVEELPDVIAMGQTDEELEADFWESLEASMTCYLEEGVRPPMPARTAGLKLPWEVTAEVPGVAVSVEASIVRLIPQTEASPAGLQHVDVPRRRAAVA